MARVTDKEKTMKLIFIHLSDLHLQNSSGIHPAKISAIVDSLQSFIPFDGILIILSGDITASGDSNQYKLASKFLGQLKTSVMERYSSVAEQNIKIILVPGNHDINWHGKPQLTSEQVHTFSEEERQEFFHAELKRMDSYFTFSSLNGCFVSDDTDSSYKQLLVRQNLFFKNGYKIEVNLVNTAPFSCSNDDGLHYLPEEAIQILTQDNPNTNMSIIIMHHSPEWFIFDQRKELENLISQRCSIAFFGHEHIAGAKQISYDNGGRIVKQAGGVWWQRSAPMVCEYHVSLFNSDTLDYSLTEFTWDNNLKSFISKNSSLHQLMLKPLNRKGIICRESYIQSLMEDKKYAVSQSISDYFIFPTLHTSPSKDYLKGQNINKMEDFIRFIEENKYVAIIGGSNSGKTTLLKELFLNLQLNYVTVYCDTDDITGRNQENILKEMIEVTYGSGNYSLFQQIPRQKKAILIDDLHRIAPKHLNKFLRGIEIIFDIIIISSEDTSKFDAVQMVKDNIKSDTEFNKVSISRLYAEKRSELIRKLVSVKIDSHQGKSSEIARTLEQCLNSYRLAFRAEIDFVVQFVNYYCDHISELNKSDATVFSKVFESSIERNIAPNLAGRKENANDIIVALSEVAYYIHFNKEYPITSKRINEIISNYCQYYDNRYLTAGRFLEIVETSNLFVRTPNGYEYRFVSKNHLAYFVAKAVNRKFYDTNDTKDLEILIQHSCFGINADILLFLTYISDNVNVPRLLLSQAISYVSDWSEFNVSDNTIKYLQSAPPQNLSSPREDQKEQDLHEQSILEEDIDEPIETLDIYDYDESQIDNLNNQLIRSLLQLQILARNLSAFISILPAKEKREYVLAIYQVPNKIFNQWASAIDNSIDQLIDEIISWQSEPDFKGKKLARDDIKYFFQDISLSMLLNLYFIASTYGANDRTVDYLSQQDYIVTSLTYRIERLMFFEKVDDYQSLIDEAESICKKETKGIARNLVLPILHRMVVNSDKISERERRRISSTYFPPRAQTNILLERQKVIKEKGI